VKAWYIRSYGGPEVLELGDRPDPEPGLRDVLIDIRAASVNPIDWKLRQGKLEPILGLSFPLILGNDLAGEVIAVGDQVTRFSPGDKVMTRPDKMRIGGFAERIAVDQDEVAAMPRSIDFIRAAAVPLVGLTAWQALVELARVQPGQTVLILAGAGGVGTMAIQIARHLGARVVTTASATKHGLLRELGADQVIDYRTQDFATMVRDCDLVLDSVGGESLARAFQVVRQGGIVVSIAGVPEPGFAREWNLGPALRAAIWLMSWPTRRRARKHGASYHFLFMHPSGGQLETLAAMIDEGVIKPVIDRTFPFEAVDEAMAYAERGHATGKVVITRDSR
jgi:NADPH:quinone reductase-like Zn-dependent oxidoreductase